MTEFSDINDNYEASLHTKIEAIETNINLLYMLISTKKLPPKQVKM